MTTYTLDQVQSLLRQQRESCAFLVGDPLLKDAILNAREPNIPFKHFEGIRDDELQHFIKKTMKKMMKKKNKEENNKITTKEKNTTEISGLKDNDGTSTIMPMSKTGYMTREKEFLTIDDLEKMLPYKKVTIYAKCKNSVIPHYKIGKKYFFKQEEIMEWMVKNFIKPKNIPIKSSLKSETNSVPPNGSGDITRTPIGTPPNPPREKSGIMGEKQEKAFMQSIVDNILPNNRKEPDEKV